MSNINIDVGNKIRIARKEKGITQDKLADMLNCDRAHISKLENGKLNPSLNYLQRIAEALEKEIEFLLK